MTLEVDTEVTIFYADRISIIGKIDRVTARRAFMGSREFVREVVSQRPLTVIGLGEWSHYSASITTDAHRKELADSIKLIKVRMFFEDLVRDQGAMLVAYDKLKGL